MLKHLLLTFDETARTEIASAFGRVIDDNRYACYACAIMPDHVHILIRKHKHSAEDMVQALMEVSAQYLRAGFHLPSDHPIWTAGTGWKVFLDTPEEIRRTITYVERNPLSYGLPAQAWSFVKQYDGWPLHAGHDPNSPYARRLRGVERRSP